MPEGFFIAFQSFPNQAPEFTCGEGDDLDFLN